MYSTERAACTGRCTGTARPRHATPTDPPRLAQTHGARGRRRARCMATALHSSPHRHIYAYICWHGPTYYPHTMQASQARCKYSKSNSVGNWGSAGASQPHFPTFSKEETRKSFFAPLRVRKGNSPQVSFQSTRHSQFLCSNISYFLALSFQSAKPKGGF